MIDKREIKGSITVFMTFIFVIIFGLVLALFENTRIISSRGYVKNASASAEKVLFGDYNKELFEEYGLFGYGGYNGISSFEMSDDFKEILVNNLSVKPENSKLSYTDIYKIRNLEVYDKNFEGLADGDNLYRQIRQYLVSEAIGDSADKLKNKYSKNSVFDKGNLCDKLDDGDSYETGKYKEKYKTEDAKDGKDKNETVVKKDKDEDTGKAADKNKNADNNKNEDLDTEEDDEEDIGNPLEVFKEIIEDGYLSLVCDSKQLSEEKIEKAVSVDEEVEDKQTESREIGADSADDLNDKSAGEYESAGSFLKSILLNANNNESTENMLGKIDGKEKLESIIYANKVFSSYVKNDAKAVDYGMEYVICGNEKEKDNLAGVVSRIIAARMVMNFVAISSDKVINAKALATATAIAGITGIEPVIKGVQYVILAILAFEESCIDTAALLDGRQIPFVKKITDIKIKYEEICLVTGSFFQEKAKQYKKSDGKIVSGYIDYKEYLFCFATFVPAEKIKTRMFDLIQFDLRKRFNESFSIYDCVVSADFEVTYEMKFIFPYLWNSYGKNLKYKKFERSLITSYGYGR